MVETPEFDTDMSINEIQQSMSEFRRAALILMEQANREDLPDLNRDILAGMAGVCGGWHDALSVILEKRLKETGQQVLV
jgi:hypothetical protein